MKVTYLIFDNGVVVHYGSKTVNVSKDDKRYAKIMELIKSGDLSQMASIACNQAKEEIRAMFKLKGEKNES